MFDRDFHAIIMKIVVTPDSFKGSVTAQRAAQCIAQGLRMSLPTAEIVECPLADGGEGTARIIAESECGDLTCHDVSGPFGEPTRGVIAWIDNRSTAVVECASASGLTLVQADQRNPLNTTSFGTGELIQHAIGLHARKIVVALGGSATNDCGLGVLQALGCEFFDGDGILINNGGCGRDLENIASINSSRMPTNLPEIFVATDVTNPLCGPRGATHIFGPQKGTDLEIERQLEAGIVKFNRLLSSQFGYDASEIPGSGAAGGIAAALISACNATVMSGIQFVMDATGLKDKIAGADAVVFGEGSLDRQSVDGKALSGLMKLTQPFGIPCYAIAGRIRDSDRDILAQFGVRIACTLTSYTVDEAESMARAEELLCDAGFNVGRAILRSSGLP